MAIADIIGTLVAHDVEFIVVGGMAAVLQGAPVHTIDLDIVYALSEPNIERLQSALTKLGAVSTGSRMLRTEVGLLRGRPGPRRTSLPTEDDGISHRDHKAMPSLGS